MRPIEQVFEIIKRAGESGIRLGDIQTLEVPEIGKRPWAHRSQVLRLVDYLKDSASVVTVFKNRAFVVPNAPVPDLSKVMASGHESELYPLLVDNHVFDEILARGHDSDSFDDVLPSQIAFSDPISSAKGKGVRLGLPDFICFVNRSLEGIPYIETHSFEVKNSRGAQREAVFQALGQRALGIYSHTWIVAVTDSKLETENQIRQLAVECRDSGIGLVVIDEAKLADELSADECLRLWPRVVAIEPRRQFEHFTALGVIDKLKSVIQPLEEA